MSTHNTSSPKRVTVTLHSLYGGASTTVRAAVRRSPTGQEYLAIGWRQLRAAAERCGHAIPSDVDGFYQWENAHDGGMVAYAERV